MSTPRDNRIEAMLAVANGDERPEVWHLSNLKKTVGWSDGVISEITFLDTCTIGDTELKPLTSPPGYHLAAIEPGELGEASKILEETEEFLDAVAQNCNIMALLELADVMGAIKAYLGKHHPTISIADLMTMNSITERAFQNGHRS